MDADASNATASVFVWYRDLAGHVSVCDSDIIIQDSLPPSAPSASIAVGAAIPSTTIVGLTLRAIGPSEVYMTNTASRIAGGWPLSKPRLTDIMGFRSRR